MVSALRANGELSYCLLLNGDAAELLNGDYFFIRFLTVMILAVSMRIISSASA